MTPYPLNYTIQRGMIWERLVLPKDKRTRRRRIPTQVAATVSIANVKYVLPVEITSEGACRLYLTPAQTNWFAVGTYQWDMAVTVSRNSLYTSFPEMQVLLVTGTLTVVDVPHLTPLASDGTSDALVAV